jgi:hypothetical protein
MEEEGVGDEQPIVNLGELQVGGRLLCLESKETSGR